MSVLFVVIIGLLIVTGITLMIWSFVNIRVSRMKFELESEYRINLHKTEMLIQKMVKWKLQNFEPHSKRLDHLESRQDKASGRSEKTVIRLAAREKVRAKRQARKQEARGKSEIRNLAGKWNESASSRETFGKKLMNEQENIYLPA